MENIQDLGTATALFEAARADREHRQAELDVAKAKHLAAVAKVDDLAVKAKEDPELEGALFDAMMARDRYAEMVAEVQARLALTEQAEAEWLEKLRQVELAHNPALKTQADLEAEIAKTREAIREQVYALAELVHAHGMAHTELETFLYGAPVYGSTFPHVVRDGVELTNNREIVVQHADGAKVYVSRTVEGVLNDALKNFEQEWRAERG